MTENTQPDTFPPIKQFFLDTAQTVLGDPGYYKLVLANEGETKALHSALSQYLAAADPKQKTGLAMTVAGVYRNFMLGMVGRAATGGLTPQKTMLLRFGAIASTMLTPEQVHTFDSVIPINTTGQPIYYLDEWLREVARGNLTLSATDGARHAQRALGSEANRMLELQNRHMGTMETITGELAIKNHQRQQLEAALADDVGLVSIHPPMNDIDNYGGPYSDAQVKSLQAINHHLRELIQLDSEIRACVDRYHNTLSAMGKVSQKISANAEGGGAVSVPNAESEMSSITDMIDILIGAKGNPFPLLSKEFYRLDPRATGFREVVLDSMAKTEAVDPGVFCRIHKEVKRRIVPEVLLLPCYGDFGTCWYPLTKSNPVTSAGRLVIPMYPKDLHTAILVALGELRWQVAKTKASSYWMSEGLTGDFYSWCVNQGMKGDPEDAFVRSYVGWITKEAGAVQVLDRDLRKVFWHHIPFPQNVKEQLIKRNAAYQDLYNKEH